MNTSSESSRARPDVSEASSGRRADIDDPARRVWLGVAGVQSRTGRGRGAVLDALHRGLARRERGEPMRPGDLRGYQPKTPSGSSGTWSVHVDDVDAWMRGEVPAPVRGVA